MDFIIWTTDGWRIEMRQFDIGDKVICETSGVWGIVEKFYFPTACAEQTMIVRQDGRRYHAPTSYFAKQEK